ncbi:AAA family ATPase [Gordonia insulae]|uniref:Orc1-like AAA ATPase domain-containing protein n=1 Tax=Gordonia insulae TaxID=2420509 RepID=A0A3G8JHS5_9ACTN|nr:AAA family ATPase [Gordonia insulae]AZG44563.1 hypothetical protein D7316_01149 [Gordonia insulae]
MEPSARKVVGREDELAHVRHCARQVVDARPCVVLIEGDAGVGKSSLVRAAGADLLGFTVLRADADELATETSMWLLSQLGAFTADKPFPAGHELLQLLSERQSEGPVAVIIEDLHWSDTASEVALLTAFRRLSPGDRVLALITTRPAGIPADSAWRRLGADPDRGRHLIIGDLTERDVAAIAESDGIVLGPTAAARLHRHTGGRALHVRTLLTELSSAELNSVAPLPAPRSLAQTVTNRVRALPNQAQAFVEALAVAGGSAGLIDLGTATASTDPSAVLAEALESGLLEHLPRDPIHRVRFVHPLYRVAVYDDISPARRRELHLAFAGAASSPAIGLHHRIAAADRVDPELAAELDVAADATGDSAQSAAYSAAAARIGEREQAARRILAAGQHNMNGRHLAAMRALEARLRSCPVSVQRDIELSWLAWQSGRIDEAETLLRDAVDLDELPQQLARAHLALSVLSNVQAKGTEGIRHARAALDLAAPGSPEAEFAAFVEVGAVGPSRRWDRRTPAAPGPLPRSVGRRAHRHEPHLGEGNAESLRRPRDRIAAVVATVRGCTPA